MDNKQKSREYWGKRARENENKVYKKAGDLKKNLDEHYIKARREIQKSINDLVVRYMDKTELSYVDAMKNLTSSEFKEWKMTLEDYERRIKEFEKDYPEYAKKLRIELETLAMKSRITRLDSLKTQIDIELNRKASRDYDVVKKGISDVYRDFYTITTSDFGLTGVNTVLPDKVLRRLLNQPWSGANFSERIWGNAETLGKVLKQEIIQSFIQGISVKDLSDRIEKRFITDRKNTERLVRTELNHALNETTKLSYEEAEIEEYEYLAEIDGRTSDICRELNGQKFKMKDAKVGVNYPPMHPYCRSTTVPVIDYENFGKNNIQEKKIKKDVIIKETTATEKKFNEAVKKVIEHGNKTGNEGLMWLDLNGNELLPFETGNTNSVAITKKVVKYLDSLKKDSVISLHNHPKSSSFSSNDMYVACFFPCIKEMRVIGHDGTKYFLRIGNGKRPDSDVIEYEYDNILGNLKSKYIELGKKVKDNNKLWKECTNEINELIAEKFGWEYRREL